MADADAEGQLSASQQEALEQYIQVTNQDAAAAVPLLQRSQWNVQIAIAKFFDGEGPDPVAEAMSAQQAPQTAARHENLQESLMASSAWPSPSSRRDRTDPAPRIVPQQPVTHRSPWLVGLLLTPFGWGWRAASTLFRTFCYVLSFLPASIRPPALTTGWTTTTGRRMLLPRDTAARFKREFDEEYGPNEVQFFEGGLAQAHDLAKKELRFLLVLLMSPEHDDTSSFVRDTLLNPEIVEFIKNPANNIIFWGGNVLDSEAYQAATEYNCTKYPFSALVCLTPKEGSTRMGIVKRLTGPMPPATYLSELQGAMEKYGVDLEGVRAERTAQEVSRNIRTEQDSAYERSLAIDRERAREKREAAAAAEEAERRAQEQADAAAHVAERRQQWKSWRAARITAEPAAGDNKVVRVALKMPEESGAGRIVRRFPHDAPMEELYAFVECFDVAPEQAGEARPDGYEHLYTFRIVSTLPRVVYEPSTTVTMGDKIGKSGNLIVESMSLESDEPGEAGQEEDRE
ncbi:UBA-like domain-containing protein [Hirsutella rhossiliensis]